MEYFRIWNILKYGIFLRMEYSENGLFRKLQSKMQVLSCVTLKILK